MLPVRVQVLELPRAGTTELLSSPIASNPTFPSVLIILKVWTFAPIMATSRLEMTRGRAEINVDFTVLAERSQREPPAFRKPICRLLDQYANRNQFGLVSWNCKELVN
jgi:hypothetical protein